MLADMADWDPSPKPGAEAIARTLAERGGRVVHYDDWKRIDREEIARGEPRGKPREKITSVDDMLEVLD